MFVGVGVIVITNFNNISAMYIYVSTLVSLRCIVNFQIVKSCDENRYFSSLKQLSCDILFAQES